MTPKERAQKIREHVNSCNNRRPKIDDCYEYIAAQIEEAQKEAEESLIERQVLCFGEDPTAKKIYAEGFRAGQEKERKSIIHASYSEEERKQIEAIGFNAAREKAQGIVEYELNFLTGPGVTQPKAQDLAFAKIGQIAQRIEEMEP